MCAYGSFGEGVVVPIEIDRSENTFTLHTDHTTYQMKAGRHVQRLCIYQFINEYA